MPSICYKFGYLSHILDDYQLSREERRPGGRPLQPEIFCAEPMTKEGGAMEEEGEFPTIEALAASSRSHLGPWMATS